MSLPDERTVRTEYGVIGFLGNISSSFTLAWLASHRDRLSTFIVGRKRLSVLVIWDSKGAALAARDDIDVAAIGRLTFGGGTKPASHPKGTEASDADLTK